MEEKKKGRFGKKTLRVRGKEKVLQGKKTLFINKSPTLTKKGYPYKANVNRGKRKVGRGHFPIYQEGGAVIGKKARKGKNGYPLRRKGKRNLPGPDRAHPKGGGGSPPSQGGKGVSKKDKGS